MKRSTAFVKPARVAVIILVAVAAFGPTGAAVDPVVAFAPHPPILIEGDAGFALPTSGVRGGSGTAGDPYRIEGWALPGLDSFAVRLVNTTAHVILRDLFFTSAGHGALHTARCLTVEPECGNGAQIRLDGASNVTMERVATRWWATGIHLGGVRDVTLRESTLGSPDDPRGETFLSPHHATGLIVEDSARVLVEDVAIHGVWATFGSANAIDVRRSSDVTFLRLHVDESSNGRIDSSERVAFYDSSWTSARAFEIFGHVQDLTVVRSTFRQAPEYITPPLLDSAPGTRVSSAFLCGNRFFDPVSNIFGNDRVVRFPSKSDNVTVRANTFENVSAVSLYDARDSTVELNRVVRSATSGSYAMSLRGAIEAHGNAFEVVGIGVALSNGVDASDNWWGSADGPSRDGPGNGTWVSVSTFNSPAPSTFTPWLAAPPDFPADPCGEPTVGLPVGPFRAPLGADVRAGPVDESLRIGDGVALGADPGVADSQVWHPADLDGPGVIGTSTPDARQGELWTLALAAYEKGSVAVELSSPVVLNGGTAGDDIDVRIYAPGALDDGLLSLDERVATSAGGVGSDERASWTAKTPGAYLVFVYGWSVATSTSFEVTGATYATDGVLAGEGIGAF